MPSYGSDVEANTLFTNMFVGDTYNIPVIDFNASDFQFPYTVTDPIFAPIPRLTNSDLTTGVVGGTGAFDILMSAGTVYLKVEYEAGRISGAEYTKAYIAMIEAAMQTSVAWLTQRDQAYWVGVNAQIEALKGKVAFAEAKIQAAGLYYEALTNKATYALTKLKMATEDVTYGTGLYQVANILPTQKILLAEQGESARAQTSALRSDGTPVAGVLGAQVSLYNQQVVSYKRDAENKAAQLWTQAWITMKTVDDGLLPPDQFSDANLNTLLTTLRNNNQI